jgi:hypothetical protein
MRIQGDEWLAWTYCVEDALMFCRESDVLGFIRLLPNLSPFRMDAVKSAAEAVAVECEFSDDPQPAAPKL